MKVLFMIPARSGSKGVKDKNIKDLCGQPLMGYTINAIKNSNAFKNGGYVFVNTDSQKYADVAKNIGANIPFLRPDSLAGDTSSINDTIKYTINKFEELGMEFDIFVMIQATSPFTTSNDIDRAIQIFQKEPHIKMVSSVTEVECPPVWCNTLNETLNMHNFISPEIRTKNRQELPKYYKITGAIRMARWKSLKNNNYDWYCENSKALIVERKYSLDIDTEEDFEYAKFLMGRMK